CTSRGCGRSTTRTTTGGSCATPTATTSRPSATCPNSTDDFRAEKRSYRRHSMRKEPVMPKRDSAPLGAPCWIDLFTSEPEASKSFYGELFGWTAEDAGEEYGHYINFSKDGVRVAGGMQNDGSGGPDAWSVYLATADAKATEHQATRAGRTGVGAPVHLR